ncbi:MAG: hypothetical protein IJD04_02965 [Desulfovibrionaceae bacterium]|nr:hypothetical protein [Desulfovibrionaceae bacterium]
MRFDDLLRFLTASRGSSISVGRGGSAGMAMLACRLIEAGRPVVVLAANVEQRLELASLAHLFTPHISKEESNPTCAVWEQPFIALPSPRPGVLNRADSALRMGGLFAVHSAERAFGLLTGVDNLLLKAPPRNFFAHNSLSVKVNDELAQDFLISMAADWGYARTPMVTQPGEFAVRGDILDIFAPGYSHPLRMEFFGDSVEQIRLFDVSTQRSVGVRDDVTLIPPSHLLMGAEQIEAAQEYWRRLTRTGAISETLAAHLEAEARRNSLPPTLMPGLYYEQASSLFAWLPSNTIFICPSFDELNNGVETIREVWSCAALKHGETQNDGLIQPPELVLSSFGIGKELAGRTRVFFEELPVEGGGRQRDCHRRCFPDRFAGTAVT